MRIERAFGEFEKLGKELKTMSEPGYTVNEKEFVRLLNRFAYVKDIILEFVEKIESSHVKNILTEYVEVMTEGFKITHSVNSGDSYKYIVDNGTCFFILREPPVEKYSKSWKEPITGCKISLV